MIPLILIGVVVVLLLVIAALAYRSQAQQAKHYSAIQKTIADAALSQTQHREALDKSLSTLDEKQRQETIDENQPQILARRDGLDNTWLDDVGLHSTAAAADHTNSAAAADAPGAAVHYVNRPDLR